MRRYLGFYWTLPVPFAAHADLPDDVDAAAAASRTVRYQRDAVRRWVMKEKGRLVAERVFMEVEPDHGTPAIADAIRSAAGLARAEGAALVLVDFAESFGWRPHPALWGTLEGAGVAFVRLPPDPLLIDGQTFDPTAHFRTWAEVWSAHKALKTARKAMLAERIGALAMAEVNNAEIAQRLNADGQTTVTGKTWTKDTVRKFLKSL